MASLPLLFLSSQHTVYPSTFVPVIPTHGVPSTVVPVIPTYGIPFHYCSCHPNPRRSLPLLFLSSKPTVCPPIALHVIPIHGVPFHCCSFLPNGMPPDWCSCHPNPQCSLQLLFLLYQPTVYPPIAVPVIQTHAVPSHCYSCHPNPRCSLPLLFLSSKPTVCPPIAVPVIPTYGVPSNCCSCHPKPTIGTLTTFQSWTYVDTRNNCL